MGPQQDTYSCMVKWRGQNFIVEINPNAALKELGEKLQKLTNVKEDTLKLLVPMEKSSKLLYPFFNEHSGLTLESTYVLKGKSLRMMGVPEGEVDEVLQNEKVDLRIAGFDEEEKRLRQRNIARSCVSRKLPQGTYIFCDFRTLSIPGIELSPPASKALELLHMLASDPGIVAIMNKHRWRVGILTEMAPIGYVGVSPKCILGVNKNGGEEISLRLRTDDLKGFRKYQSIKKTLLHELAHMIYSEHDANFYALDSQLNREASTLDWTKSGGHTLSRVVHSQNYEVGFDTNSSGTASQKLGGQTSIFRNARASSVNAAFQRLAQASTTPPISSEELTPVTDPGVSRGNQNVIEPDPDTSEGDRSMELECHVESGGTHVNIETDPENIRIKGLSYSGISPSARNSNVETVLEPERDDSGPDLMETFDHTIEVPNHVTGATNGPDSNDSQIESMQLEPDPDEAIPSDQAADPDIDYPELQIIQDHVTIICDRLQKSIQSLKYEVNNPSESGTVIRTLIKIIRNVTEHPNETKFKKLRKANPTLQRNIFRYKAAMDILQLIGFYEDTITDEFGRTENFLVFKRNDPGLLWLAKSSLESSIA